jgi:hypothetical protein
MKNLFYSWLVLQILAGAWLFISPFVMGVEEVYVMTNNMLFGALLAILGVGMIFYEYFRRERIERGLFLRNLYYPWVAFQFLMSIWLYVSPFTRGFSETRIAINDMLFGTIGVIFGIGTLFFEMYHREEFDTLEHIKGRA